MNSKAREIVLVGLIVSVFAVSGQAVAGTWALTFNDVVNNTNVGFDDPNSGAEARSTAVAVTDYINSVLDFTGNITFRFDNSQTDGSGVGASASAVYTTTPLGFQSGAVFENAVNHNDITAPFGVPNGKATVDFGFTWNVGLDPTTLSEFDLFSTLLHEITHTLGIASNVNSNGNSRISGGNPGAFTTYDSFLEKGDGTVLFGAGGNYLGNAGDLVTDVFFDGPNARAANGGTPVRLNTPSPFVQGGSISHPHPDTLAFMSRGAVPGESFREYTAIDLGMLEDIGWTLTVAPEPSTASFLALASLLMLGRRNRCVFGNCQ